MKKRLILTVILAVIVVACVALFFGVDEIYRAGVDVFVPMPRW